MPQEATLGEMRKLLVSDAEFERMIEDLPADWERAEAQEIRFRRAAQHSDLHGENILVCEENHAVLIDFARVGMLPAPIDPVMLELSFVFHPGGREIRGAWPAVADAEKWCSLDDFVAKCPISDVVRACRAWAHEVTSKISDRSIYGSAYLYTVWQLKFETTDRNVARAIGAAAIRALIND